MKIVPIVTQKGVFYSFIKSTWLGKRYLSSGGKWSNMADRIDCCFHAPMHFESPSAAAKEIRKQFGERANIDVWEGN